MTNNSIFAAFERMWQHVKKALNSKSDIDHSHDDLYYTETEVDAALAKKADFVHGHEDLYFEISDTRGDVTYLNNLINELVGYTSVPEQIKNALAQNYATQIITWEADD